MFDAGTGGQVALAAGLIGKKDMMKAAGIDPAKISTIIVTHFHADHIFGLMAKDTNANISQCGDSGPVRRIQVLGRSRRIHDFGGTAPRAGQAHPGHVADVEEHQAGRGREGSRARRACGCELWPHARAHELLVSSGGKQLMVLADVTNIPPCSRKIPIGRLLSIRTVQWRRQAGTRCSIESLPISSPSRAITTACRAPARSRRTARVMPSCR